MSYLDEAKEAIRRVFSDTSVPRSKTREDLEELVTDIDIALSALAEDDALDAADKAS